MLKEYFPLFNREKMIRELVVFHFQERDCPLREFIKEVVDAAEFFQYCASEGDIVERILMNLHLEILAQADFLPRPRSYGELRDMVSLIEKRMVVLAERQRPDTDSSSFQMVERGGLLDKLGGSAFDSKQSSKSGLACWHCEKQGHVQRNCKGHNYSGAVAAIYSKRGATGESVGSGGR